MIDAAWRSVACLSPTTQRPPASSPTPSSTTPAGSPSAPITEPTGTPWRCAITAPPSASPTATAGRSTARSGPANGSPAWPPPSPPASIRRRPGPSPSSCRASCSPGRRRSCAASLLGHPGQGTPRGGARLPLVSGRRPRAAAEGCGPRPPRARVRGRGRARLPRHEQPGQRPLLRELRLRGDRARAAPTWRRHPLVHEASLRRCASGSPSSFFNVLFSICRMRSRVTPKARPTSSSVRAFPPASP